MPILVVVALLLLALGALVYAFFIAGRDEDLSLVDRMHNRVAYRSDLSAGPIDGLFKRLDAALDPDADFTVEPTGGLNRFHSDAYQAVMEEIQGRGLDQILPFAETWSRAPAPHKRATAAELVGALSDEEVSSVTLSRATALILRLAADRDPRVVIAALQALRARHGEPYPEQVLAKVHALCASHKDEMIRLAFVDQLFPLAPDTEQGYAAVIAMAPDAAPIVRRAVCFKIGELAAMSNYDSPALRAALASRLDDSDAEVRSFAIEGLALRQDARATPALARDLVLCAEGVADKDDRTEPVTEADKQARLAKQRNTMKMFGAMNQLVSAAAAMPDRRLIPGLQALSACFSDMQFRDVLAACQRAPQSAKERAEAAWGSVPKPAADNADSVRGPLPDAPEASLHPVWGPLPKAVAPPVAAPVARFDDATLKDYAKLTKALRRASVAELLDAHVLAQATDNLFAGEQIRLECNRRPLADVLPAARGLSTDADVAKRIAAAMSLTRETEAMASAERSGLTLLLDLSDDADKRVVLAALKAISLRLQRPFDPRMAARLRAFEAHPDFDVRVAYSRIFTSPYMHDEMRDPSEVAVWIRLMQDPSPVMRAGACRHMHLCACMPEAARMVDREDVRQALRQRLGDDDAEVRNAALLALALMEDRTVPAAIDRELHHLALADATVPTQALLDALRTVSEAIGFNPDSRYVAGITRVAELVLHRAEQERDPDEPSNSNSHGFPEDLADLIQSCKAAGSKRKSAV